MRILPACCLLSCGLFLLLIYFIFLIFLPFFRLRLDIACLWVLRCLLGFDFCCDSFRMRVLVGVWYVSWCIPGTYVPRYNICWSHRFVFLSEVRIPVRFVSVYCVSSSVSYKYLFPPEEIFRSKVIGACLTADCIVGSDNNNSKLRMHAYVRDVRIAHNTHVQQSAQRTTYYSPVYHTNEYMPSSYLPGYSSIIFC